MFSRLICLLTRPVQGTEEMTAKAVLLIRGGQSVKNDGILLRHRTGMIRTCA